MPARNETGALRAYRLEVERTHASGQATEHSYRPALERLIEALEARAFARSTNPPTSPAARRISSSSGAAFPWATSNARISAPAWAALKAASS